MILKKISIGKRPFYGVCYISRKITVMVLENLKQEVKVKQTINISKAHTGSNKIIAKCSVDYSRFSN
jgi:hypothetical protein